MCQPFSIHNATFIFIISEYSLDTTHNVTFLFRQGNFTLTCLSVMEEGYPLWCSSCMFILKPETNVCIQKQMRKERWVSELVKYTKRSSANKQSFYWIWPLLTPWILSKSFCKKFYCWGKKMCSHIVPLSKYK